MPKIYLAGPLFGVAEREFNRHLASALMKERPDWVVVLPQERATELLRQPMGVELVFNDCLGMVQQSDAVLAILDGADSDSGTCIEMGYAYALKRPIVGVRTDFRGSEDRGLNLMVSHVCTRLVCEPMHDTASLAKALTPLLEEVLRLDRQS